MCVGRGRPGEPHGSLEVKHLDAGNPLEPSLPPDNGNIIGELG